jgi:penicillin-binding protein 2
VSDLTRVRVSIVGVVVVALFAALLARLWFLDVGPERSVGAGVQSPVYARRVIQTESPRGRILDRNGVPLVVDRVAWAMTLDRSLAPREHARVLAQLSRILHVPAATLQARYDDPRQPVLKPAVIAVDVTQGERLQILERAEDFRGVYVEQLTVRSYPQGTLAAQLLGYVGDVPADQLAKLKMRGYDVNDTIGRAGIEAAYERDLRGRPMRETVQVDPTGKQVGPPLRVEPGAIGDDLYLSLNVNVQRIAEDSLLQGIAQARTLRTKVNNQYVNLTAPAGSVVVLNVRDGSVLAMASYPWYDPTTWVGGISPANFAALNDPAQHTPLLERATQGQYAPGSSFKLVTSLAMLWSGVRTVNTYYADTGQTQIGNTVFHNDSGEVLGGITLPSAIARSSNAYFASAGGDMWNRWRAGDPNAGLALQNVAHDFGFGAPTGIEIDEAKGFIGDPKWKQATANAIWPTEEQKRENGGWYPGDEANLAIGQGVLTVTPLQLADAYATFANGGTLWQPHLGMAVKNPATNALVRGIAPHAVRTIPIDPVTRQAMLAGFEGVVTYGTAAGAFQGFPFAQVLVAGKTGTAQVPSQGPTSLFAGFFPADNPQYVIVSVVEGAGYGAQTSAPIVRHIIEQMSGLQAAPVHVNAGGND